MVCLFHNNLISDSGPNTILRSAGTNEDKILLVTKCIKRDFENAEYSR